jgi:hypothetical protein
VPSLALNLNPPDLCLLSGWDYRREPPAPTLLGSLHLDLPSCLTAAPLSPAHRTTEVSWFPRQGNLQRQVEGPVQKGPGLLWAADPDVKATKGP